VDTTNTRRPGYRVIGASNQTTPVTPAMPFMTVRIAFFAAESVDRIGSKTKSYPQSQRSAESGFTTSHLGHSFVKKGPYSRTYPKTRPSQLRLIVPVAPNVSAIPLAVPQASLKFVLEGA
jgi:hypothetical protein